MKIYDFNNFLINEKIEESPLKDFYNKLKNFPKQFPRLFKVIDKQEYENLLKEIEYELISKEKEKGRGKKEERIEELESRRENLEDKLNDILDKYISTIFGNPKKDDFTVFIDADNKKIHLKRKDKRTKQLKDKDLLDDLRKNGKTIELPNIVFDEFDSVLYPEIKLPVDLNDKQYKRFFDIFINDIFDYSAEYGGKHKNLTYARKIIDELQEIYKKIEDKEIEKRMSFTSYDVDDFIQSAIDMLPNPEYHFNKEYDIMDRYYDEEIELETIFKNKENLEIELENAEEYLRN